VLLLCGSDPASANGPGPRWWFTVGGAAQPGETLSEAAVRELAEETGLSVAPDDVIGPVWRRDSVIDFNGSVIRSEEMFFVHRTSRFEPSTSGRSALERRYIHGHRWCDETMIGELVAGHGDTALQYCTAQGDAGLRERICEIMALEEIRAHPDEIVVTVGSQQAVDLVTRIFCDPGDVVICEAPSYVGALGVFKAYQVDVVHVAMDEHCFLLTGRDVQGEDLAAYSTEPFFLETSRPGIFAVGDVRSGSIKRVASGVGEGSMAVSLIHEYLANP